MAISIDSKSQGDLVLVSKAKQADAATAATLDTLFTFDETSYIRQVREAEVSELSIGQIEPGDVDVLSYRAEGLLNMPKVTPHAVAWALSKVCGAETDVAALGTNGYRHRFALTDFPDNPAYFTAAHRKGGASSGSSPADYQRHRGLAIGTMEIGCQKSGFLIMALGVVGTGYVDDAVITEIITGVDLTATFTLVISNDPYGSTAAEQLAHLDLRADDDGDGIFEMELTATSYAEDPSFTVTFADPSGTNSSANVRVSYRVMDDEAGYTWQSGLEAISTIDEFVCKSTNMRFYQNAAIDVANPTFPTRTGGQYAECELDDFIYRMDRGATPGVCWRVLDTSSSDFAQAVDLGAFSQRITVNRRVRDFLVKQNFDLNAPFGVEINAIGPEIDSGESNYYQVSLYFPYCKILTREQNVNEGKWRDSFEIAVLKEVGAGNPSMVAMIVNAQATYPA